MAGAGISRVPCSASTVPLPRLTREPTTPVGAEAPDSGDGAHDVHEGVEGSELVEVHRLRRHPVDPALGLENAAQQPRPGLPDLRREPAAVENGDEVPEHPVAPVAFGPRRQRARREKLPREPSSNRSETGAPSAATVSRISSGAPRSASAPRTMSPDTPGGEIEEEGAHRAADCKERGLGSPWTKWR